MTNSKVTESDLLRPAGKPTSSSCVGRMFESGICRWVAPAVLVPILFVGVGFAGAARASAADEGMFARGAHAQSIQTDHNRDPFFSSMDMDESSSGRDFNFEGIVALNNCSGSLVRFADSVAGDQALVLTNGHCVGMLGEREVIINKRDGRRFTVLGPAAERLGSVNATRLIYATMYRTDMALYELAQTFGDIENVFGVRALTLASEPAAVGSDIEVISGYWKRGYACFIERYVHELREGKWVFNDSLKYSDPGCQVIGGTSGSPVVAVESREVVAVNNTGNESGQACQINNPCEIDEEGGIQYQKGWSYAQQTVWIYGCRAPIDSVEWALAASHDLDLTRKGCMLPSSPSK
jgi:V8-like Glu-specific endopeptidase